MKHYLKIILIILLNQPFTVFAIDFSDKDKSVIYTKAVKVLNDYQSVINQIGFDVVTDVEKTKSSVRSFLELFVNRQVLIFNDLDPLHRLSEFYEAETYTNNIILWYPDGISVRLNLDSAMVGEIISHNQNVYSLDILIKKNIDGNYMNQTLNRNIEEIIFRVAFTYENRAFENFRIAGIRNISSNYLIDFSQTIREVNNEEINEVDMTEINNEIKSLVNDYTNFLSLLGDIQEQESDREHYRESFLNLFSSGDTRLFNDINPQPQASLITVTDYLAFYRTDYPGGIRNLSINSDSIRIGRVMKEEDGSFYTYANADKFFSGNFRGKEVFRKMFPLIFRISFRSDGKTYSDFRISSIDLASINYFEADPGTAPDLKPDAPLRPVSRQGFVLSLMGSFGQTRITNQNIESLTTEEDLHSWNTTPLYGFITGLGVSYYFNNNFYLRSGLELNRYSASFNLTGNFTDNELSTDINSSTYNKVVETAFDSVVVINYITLPVLAGYTSGSPYRIGFYAEGGIKLSIAGKASYDAAGDYKFSGFYPDKPKVLQNIDIPELGFYTRENIDKNGPVSINGLNILFYASAGINIPLGYFSSVTLGPEISLGISDIFKDRDTYSDIFDKSYDYQPTKTKSFGCRIILAYKL